MTFSIDIINNIIDTNRSVGDMLNHSRKSLSECFAPVTRKRVGSSVVEQLTAGHQSEAKQSAGPGFDSLPALFVSPWNEDAEFFFSFFLLFFPGAERQTTTRPRVTRGPGRHGDGAQGLGGAGGRGRAGPGRSGAGGRGAEAPGSGARVRGRRRGWGEVGGRARGGGGRTGGGS